MSLPAHVIRPGGAGDRGYIVDSWLQSYRPSPFATQLPDWAYWSHFGHVGIVESIMESSPALVACLPDARDFIYAWAVGDRRGFLHYVFVRNDFREQGFAKALVDALGMSAGPLRVTHMTQEFSRRIGKSRKVEFCNPYRGERR